MGQKHLTLWGHVADPLMFAVSKSVWDYLSPQDQALLRETAIDAGKYGKDLARKGITEQDPSLLKDIEGHGVQVTRLSPADRDRGAPRDAAPPTPPGIRVRTMAVREFG